MRVCEPLGDGARRRGRAAVRHLQAGGAAREEAFRTGAGVGSGRGRADLARGRARRRVREGPKLGRACEGRGRGGLPARAARFLALVLGGNDRVSIRGAREEVSDVAYLEPNLREHRGEHEIPGRGRGDNGGHAPALCEH